MANNIFSPKSLTKQNGAYHMDGERVVLLSISAIGTLKEDIESNIGKERLKGFLIRHGKELGSNDARKALTMNFSTVQESIQHGTVMHTLKGHARVETTYLKIEKKDDEPKFSIHMEGDWLHSYEAEEYVNRYGLANEPICNTLVGYASGYLSVISNQQVIVKEITCEAKGDACCHWVAKSIDLCDEDTIKNELKYYKEDTIIAELGYTYEKLLEERNNLTRATNIYSHLTEEIFKGNNLQSIAEVVCEATGTPITIDDVKFRSFAYAGLSPDEYAEVNVTFTTYLENYRKEHPSFLSIKKIVTATHTRLLAPIFIGKKVSGYCSFIYIDSTTKISDIDFMILERISLACSIYLLNEKNCFEATERMKGYFLDNILSGKITSKKDILQRGNFINLDLTQSYYIIFISYQSMEEKLSNELVFHEAFMETIAEFLKRNKLNVLFSQRTNGGVLLVPTSILTKTIEFFSREVLQFLSRMHPLYRFRTGISMAGTSIEQACKHYDEAKTALHMTTERNDILSFESLGVVGMLINQNNEEAVKQMSRYTLGKLYDNPTCSKNKELLRTLYVYLENGGNLEQTSDELCLSVSGLRYRLQKIKSLLGQDLSHPYVNYQLFLSLQALIITGELSIMD
ncbi:XylR N-terminal domain-containing protein [Aneurinibacillus aneurinilyticus]|jgi:sugar diacid utilization regulator/predicted hydrocarbon binding protein|uniref:XylR N-terminal domain-containing protein n=1 Tax=Aneurinibacillus aneurinilyticus TaxID=1391 RepID=UPI0023F854F3|nr:XylR N-terminal domain-containing protein [Aneurinibacillus aneurinilyticus]MCI1696525.1 helix-turn-helix domain-containing protein [Aneurinibacillus aneurinilyticus]